MIAAMSIELFVWIYGISLGVVAFGSAALLIMAARYIGRQDRALKQALGLTDPEITDEDEDETTPAEI